MRVGLAGLDALYWPAAMGNGLIDKAGVQFLAAATLGESDSHIRDSLGMTPDEYAAKYRVRLYSQPEEMVASEKLDTAVIISRHSEHAHWAERLATLGVNLFIPKTLATTVHDADRIVQAERDYGIKVAVGPSARYLPAMAAVKHALDQGLIGRPFAIRVCHHHGVIDVFHQNDWYRDPLEGGPELSLGWYGIDLVQQLMDAKVARVYAQYSNYTSPDSPFMDCGRMTMALDGGGSAAFDMLFCNRLDYPAWQLEVIGPQGIISIHRAESGSTRTAVTLDRAGEHTGLSLPEHTPHWEMFWVDELLAGKAPSLTAEYARQVTVVSLAARESARLGREIVVADYREEAAS
ncbi:MAG: Gfo/Idh/MocA family protein [Anaerolineae bacterium]